VFVHVYIFSVKDGRTISFILVQTWRAGCMPEQTSQLCHRQQ